MPNYEIIFGCLKHRLTCFALCCLEIGCDLDGNGIRIIKYVMFSVLDVAVLHKFINAPSGQT